MPDGDRFASSIPIPDDLTVEIARCDEHGLHGDRSECFVCSRPVERVPMVAVADLPKLYAAWGDVPVLPRGEAQDGEPRTIREARLAIREAEEAVAAVHLSPAVSLGRFMGWYLRKARLALRQAERAAADADDPRLDALKPLSPQIPDLVRRSRRARYRCPVCFSERLLNEESFDRHESLGLQPLRCWAGPVPGCRGVMEPVGRMRRRPPAGEGSETSR